MDVLTPTQREIMSRFSRELWAHDQEVGDLTEDYDQLIELGLLKRDPWHPTSYAITESGLIWQSDEADTP